ncbi:MAG: hypothetical protein ACPGQL_00145 [Thermoplasmatota archaeon]
MGRERIVCCLRCGSLKLRPLTLSDGLFADGGELFKWVCDDCHWQGTPIEFDRESDYKAFVAALRDEEEEEE